MSKKEKESAEMDEYNLKKMKEFNLLNKYKLIFDLIDASSTDRGVLAVVATSLFAEVLSQLTHEEKKDLMERAFNIADVIEKENGHE